VTRIDEPKERISRDRAEMKDVMANELRSVLAGGADNSINGLRRIRDARQDRGEQYAGSYTGLR
jgi:hypothetical protein